MVQKWLGNYQLTTFAIYANAVGTEEQSIAARMFDASSRDEALSNGSLSGGGVFLSGERGSR